MKRSLLALFGLLLAARCAAVPSTLEVHNTARAFVTFWDATQGVPSIQRISEFKQQIGAQFPQFYGIDRYQGKRTQAQQDMLIGRVLERFGPLRQAYLDTVNRFDADLPRYIASFQLAFPDFVPGMPTYFVNSLGEMDGGTRTFDGHDVLIFGADLMSQTHAGRDEAAFFHHELFHTYHHLASITCPQRGMWLPLWTEGLAVYVSKVLNPNATEQEIELDFPAGALAITKGQLPAAWAQLDRVLDDGDEALYDPLFSTGKDDTGLAPRRGYYLGYLVARELGKTHDLHTLAELDCGAAHDLVVSTVHRLRRQAGAPGVAQSTSR